MRRPANAPSTSAGPARLAPVQCLIRSAVMLHAACPAPDSATNKTASAQLSLATAHRWERRPGTPSGALGVEDGRCLDVAYPRGMSDIPELLAAIDSRLADLAAEIAVLESAKAALEGPRTIGRSPAGATDAVTARSGRRPRRARRTRSPKPTEPAASGTTAEPAMSVHEDGSATTPKRSTRKAPAKGARPRRAGVAVRAETLEQLLADTSAGLSANAIAEHAGAGYNPTLKLLRELEAAGRVRRSGSRRSTVWRLVSDEERISERTVELERRGSVPSRQRRRARAS